MRVTGNVKSHWGKFYSKINCHVPVKGGSYKRKKCNMKRRSGYPMTMRRRDPEGRKEGPQEKKNLSSKGRSPTEAKTLNYSCVGCK